MSGTAHIDIPINPKDGPSQATTLTSSSPTADVNAVFDGFDDLLASCHGLKMEDRLTVLITACIERGIHTRERIVGTAWKKSFNKDRTSKFLTKSTGSLWRRSKDGIYSLIA